MFNIDIRSSKPIYEQLTNQVKENVLKGYLKEGDLLPSVRKMAAALGINPNTVSKAYQELERQKIISAIRGRGMVINSIEKQTADITPILEKITPLIVELKYAGKTDEEILEEIKKICDNLGGNI